MLRCRYRGVGRAAGEGGAGAAGVRGTSPQLTARPSEVVSRLCTVMLGSFSVGFGGGAGQDEGDEPLVLSQRWWAGQGPQKTEVTKSQLRQGTGGCPGATAAGLFGNI